MDDNAIITLYWERNEAAIGETDRKYGPACLGVAIHILDSQEDAEECVNDTWLRAWRALVPTWKPERLRAFLLKITRNLSFDRVRGRQSAKRGGGQLALALDELEECVAGSNSAEEAVLLQELEESVSWFLQGLPPLERHVFLRRYFYVEPAGEIGARYQLSPGHVRTMLSRTRKKLRNHLEKEGFL